MTWDSFEMYVDFVSVSPSKHKTFQGSQAYINIFLEYFSTAYTGHIYSITLLIQPNETGLPKTNKPTCLLGVVL